MKFTDEELRELKAEPQKFAYKINDLYATVQDLEIRVKDLEKWGHEVKLQLDVIKVRLSK